MRLHVSFQDREGQLTYMEPRKPTMHCGRRQEEVGLPLGRTERTVANYRRHPNWVRLFPEIWSTCKNLNKHNSPSAGSSPSVELEHARKIRELAKTQDNHKLRYLCANTRIGSTRSTKRNTALHRVDSIVNHTQAEQSRTMGYLLHLPSLNLKNKCFKHMLRSFCVLALQAAITMWLNVRRATCLHSTHLQGNATQQSHSKNT